MVWSKHFDPSTRLYYYHDAATLETTWELPSGAQVMPFLILASKQRNEVPVPFVVPAPPWKGFMDDAGDTQQYDNNGDSGELDDDADGDERNGSGEEAMALEVRQMAMEAFLQESGLQVYTRRLLELGVKSMGGLADPSVLSDADLIKTVGMTMGQVGLFRKSTGAVSVHLPPNVRKSISLSCGLSADSAAPQAAPPVVSTPPAAAAAAALAAAAPATSSASAARVSEYLPRSVVHWSGWLEKRGRSAFSKVEKRYFVLREGGPPTTSFEEHSAVKFGEPMYYSLEYFAAPPNLKYNVGLDVGEDPLSKGYEQKGCLDVAQVSSVSLGSKADKKRTVSFTTPEKPFELVAVSEACASDLDTALSRCLESLQKPCVALTLPPHSPPASPSAAPPAAPPTPEQASASAATSSRSDPSALAPPSSSSSPSPVFAVDAMPSRSSSSGSKATAQGDSRESAAKDNDFFKQQAEAKRSERESMLKKMTSEQKGAFLKEEADVKAHDDRKSKHVLKTTRAFGPAGGNPLTSGRGGRGGRGGGGGGGGGGGRGGGGAAPRTVSTGGGGEVVRSSASAAYNRHTPLPPPPTPTATPKEAVDNAPDNAPAGSAPEPPTAGAASEPLASPSSTLSSAPVEDPVAHVTTTPPVVAPPPPPLPSAAPIGPLPAAPQPPPTADEEDHTPLRSSGGGSAKDGEFFKQQAEAKRSERESMLKKMTLEQKGAFLKEEADMKAHDDRKSKHVLKTTRAFGPAGGNPLTSGRGGRGGRGGK